MIKKLLITMLLCLIPLVASGRGYLLQDEFTTALSAGNVNNTTSEPSGHTRTVTDTESKLSIADGKLTFSGGKAVSGVGDPAIWYPSFARVGGRILFGNYNTIVADTFTYWCIGWDTDQTTFITPHFVGRTTTHDMISSEGSGYLAPFTAGNSYIFASILRELGQFTFMSENGGAWKYLWSDSDGISTPLYPSIGNYSSLNTTDYLRIPNALWLPTPIASDGFGTAGATDGLGHSETTGIGSGGGGLAWSSGGSTWSVSGGISVNTPTLGSELWDSTASTFESGVYSWTPNGNNTVENDAGKLKITYVDSANGGVLSLNDAADLSSDLVDGQWYDLSFDSMLNLEAQGYALYVQSGADALDVAWVTANIMTPYNTCFRANHATNMYIYTGVMSAGQIVYLDNMSLKPLTLSQLINTVPTATPDVVATVKLNGAEGWGGWQGIALNVDSTTNPQNMVVVRCNGYTVILEKLVNGTWTNVMFVGITYIPNIELRVIKDGTTYRVYYNDALVGTVSTVSDAEIINNTRHGVFSTQANNALDNFTLYARGTGGEYSKLDRLMNDKPNKSGLGEGFRW